MNLVRMGSFLFFVNTAALLPASTTRRQFNPYGHLSVEHPDDDPHETENDYKEAFHNVLARQSLSGAFLANYLPGLPRSPYTRILPKGSPSSPIIAPLWATALAVKNHTAFEQLLERYPRLLVEWYREDPCAKVLAQSAPPLQTVATLCALKDEWAEDVFIKLDASNLLPLAYLSPHTPPNAREEFLRATAADVKKHAWALRHSHQRSLEHLYAYWLFSGCDLSPLRPPVSFKNVLQVLIERGWHQGLSPCLAILATERRTSYQKACRVTLNHLVQTQEQGSFTARRFLRDALSHHPDQSQEGATSFLEHLTKKLNRVPDPLGQKAAVLAELEKFAELQKRPTHKRKFEELEQVA